VRTVPGEFALPELLGDTSRVTLRSDDCAVTALVVYKNSEDAGKGLNALAITENLLPENPSDDEKDRFWTKDMNLAYALWPRQRHAPWARFRPGSA
jgi:hypothetical protein